jgi:hypothetical protein
MGILFGLCEDHFCGGIINVPNYRDKIEWELCQSDSFFVCVKVGEAVQGKAIEIAYRGEKPVPPPEKQRDYEEWNDEKMHGKSRADGMKIQV